MAGTNLLPDLVPNAKPETTGTNLLPDLVAKPDTAEVKPAKVTAPTTTATASDVSKIAPTETREQKIKRLAAEYDKKYPQRQQHWYEKILPINDAYKASAMVMEQNRRPMTKFEREFAQQFNPIEAITKEGLIPKTYGYAKKKLTGQEFAAPPEKEISFSEAMSGLKQYAKTSPGGLIGTIANAIIADPELLFVPEFLPARAYKAAQASGKLATTGLKAADASTQAAAITAAHSIVNQLNETGTVDMKKVGNEVAVGTALTGGTVLGLGGAAAAGRGVVKSALGGVQPAIVNLANSAEKLGFKLEPAQVRADKPIGSPGYSEANKLHNENLATKLSSRETGFETENITPTFVGDVKKKLGSVYQNIFNRKFNISFEDAQNFSALRNFEASVMPAGSRNIANASNNLVQRWNKEYMNQLLAMIQKPSRGVVNPKLAQRGVGTIGMLASKGWRNLRQATDATAPVYAKPVEEALHDLASKLGFKEMPKIYFGKWGRPSSTTYGMASRDGYIVVSDQFQNVNDAVATAVHEFGHQAEFLMFVNAPKSEQEAVVAAFLNQMRETPVGKLNVEQHRPITAAKYPKESRLAIDASYERNYLRKWEEWYAEQTSRWITQTKAPTTVVEKYFKKVADVWKEIYQRVTGYLPMVKEVDAFYRSKWNPGTAEELNPFLVREVTVSEGGEPAVILSPADVTASMDGAELQRLRSAIADIARTHADGQIRYQAGKYVELIDSMIEKSHPELRSLLQQTNRRYAAALTLEEGIRRGFISQGKISLKSLGDYLAGSNQISGFGSGTSRHPLYDLGYMGRELNMTSRVEGMKLPEYDTLGALIGRGKQLLSSKLGTRNQGARALQRSYGQLDQGTPQIPYAPYAPYAAGVASQSDQIEAMRQERNRRLQEALRTQFGGY